jgi:hypothetical protein
MPEPDEEGEERFGLPGTFEENLQKVLEVDPKDLEDEEEPPQD